MADECEPVEPVPGTGPPPGPTGPEIDLTEVIEKLCALVDILVASDPDGDGIINVEGMIDVNLEGQCLTIDNCGETVLTVELSAEALADLVGALEDTCLSFKQCEGEVFDVAVTGPVDVNVDWENMPPIEIESLDCWVVTEPVVGCLEGECVNASRLLLVTKSGEVTELADTLPEGAVAGPCPEVTIIRAPIVACDKRRVLEGAATHDLAAILGLSVGVTPIDIVITVQSVGDETALPTITDCEGDATTMICGETIRLSGCCGDYVSTFQEVTTSPGDRVTIEARICPPSIISEAP